GAVLAGVAIEVQGGTTERALVTDQEGFYRAAGLPAGAYTVTARLNGFDTAVVRDVVVPVDRTVSVDLRLSIAGRSEAVTVVAAPLVDLTTSSTSRIIDATTIDTIPLNGRNYLDLLQLAPGVAVNA